MRLRFVTLPSPVSYTCSQCGLNYARGGVRFGSGEAALNFCCSGCAVTHSVLGSSADEGESTIFLARLGFAAFLSMNIMAVSWMIYDKGFATFGIPDDVRPTLEALLFVLSLPVMILVGFPFAKAAWKELTTRSISTDSLIAFGSFTAFFFSTYQLATGGRAIYYDTATMTLVLVTFGRYVEATAKERARHSLKDLLELQPHQVRVIRNDSEETVAASGVFAGETIRILPGERIPLDGIVTQGNSTSDESALTGESVPRPKSPGDTVLAATLNIDGSLLVRVTAVSTDTAHMQAVKLLDEARASRSSLQTLVDRVSSVFLPSVIVGSVLTTVVWSFIGPVEHAFVVGLSVLVVSCPCALGIGTPLALTYSLNSAARRGVLVRGHSVFERLTSVREVLFDKTGTLTSGTLSVRKWICRDSLEKSLRYIAAVECHSTHPVGRAIVRHVAIPQHELPAVENVKVSPGQGIEGVVVDSGRRVVVSIFHARDHEDSPAAKDLRNRGRMRRPNETDVMAQFDGVPHALIYLSDTLRPDAPATVQTLNEMGLASAMISGDARSVVEHTAAEAGIQRAFSELLPAQKLEKIAEMKREGPVVMVGDGINDAPSLVAADVGIAMAGGTDIAKEQADVVIVGDRLSSVTWLIRHSRKTVSVIRWNLFWAFGYNFAAIALAAVGLLQPVWAAGAMVVSSVSIIAHSRRAGR